ncbi:MAG: hypothetical protein ACFFAN_13695 [Promethearchaeota archaeon]
MRAKTGSPYRVGVHNHSRLLYSSEKYPYPIRYGFSALLPPSRNERFFPQLREFLRIYD